jgi:hypothetical protein
MRIFILTLLTFAFASAVMRLGGGRVHAFHVHAGQGKVRLRRKKSQPAEDRFISARCTRISTARRATNARSAVWIWCLRDESEPSSQSKPESMKANRENPVLV